MFVSLNELLRNGVWVNTNGCALDCRRVRVWLRWRRPLSAQPGRGGRAGPTVSQEVQDRRRLHLIAEEMSLRRPVRLELRPTRYDSGYRSEIIGSDAESDHNCDHRWQQICDNTYEVSLRSDYFRLCVTPNQILVFLRQINGDMALEEF